jgi:hypothetical protein
MTEEDKARKIYELCVEFDYIDIERLPFDKLYTMAEADRSLDVSTDQKTLCIITGLLLESTISDGMQNIPICEELLKEINDMENFDWLKILFGLAIIVGGTTLAFYIKSHFNSNTLENKKLPVPPPQLISETQAIQEQPVVPKFFSASYLLLSIETTELNKKFPSVISNKFILITSENKQPFYHLPWYLLPNQDKDFVNGIRSFINSTVKEGFALLSIDLPESEMAHFKKEVSGSEKREAFSKLEGKRISVLGVISNDQFDKIASQFHTI